MSVTLVNYPVSVIKRDGTVMPFDGFKIRNAIAKAAMATEEETMSQSAIDAVTSHVLAQLPAQSVPTVEHVQDTVEQGLIIFGYGYTAKAYILYRADHNRRRRAQQDLMQLYKEISFADASDVDMKRENANIDANTAMGTMLKYGSEGSKHFVDKYILPEDMEEAHRVGEIHIHDKDFYLLTQTCCQIDLIELFNNGFSTGHGYLRKPNSIQSYSALACIAIQANQNEMHGGQSVPHFDYAMAPGVDASWKKAVKSHLVRTLEQHLIVLCGYDEDRAWAVAKEKAEAFLEDRKESLFLDRKSDLEKALRDWFLSLEEADAEKRWDYLARAILRDAYRDVDRETYQAMEAFIHNLNTMNSRAGAQVPFSSVNYGTDTSEAGRLVIKNLLQATRRGLGNSETAIFPVQIFKVKEGVNYEEEDPNYDLFQLAMITSSERLFPNFSFLDAPFNAQYYKKGDYNSEVAYMGCRTRVMGNVYDPSREVTCGRGNLSFTSVNLPRIGLESHGDWDRFYAKLEERMALICRQLLHRLRIQGVKTLKNFPFLMGQGIWLDSKGMGPDDTIEEVLKHGTLTIGFIGLAEALVAMTGAHHGESNESQLKGLEIVEFMRGFTDRKAEETGLNFSLIATPAEGLSGRFVRLDAAKYGYIPGVTDRDYYTNSFHVPVYYKVGAYQKIQIEAPYHQLTNAGHITYVEMDGAPSNNIAAFESVIRCMKESGIGYGSVNHPLDRDSVCGYTGVIDERCPKCGRRESDGPKFQRIRRITGYLVGTLDRFNDAKASEEKDRLTHKMAR